MKLRVELRGHLWLETGKQWVCDSCRAFSTSTPLFSGHSRWSTIKHDKAKNDKAKSKERAIISKEIINASQMWGPDPKFNPRLNLAITNAKRAGLPKASIEASIARGQGISVSGEALEPVTIEAMLPGAVAAVIECLTDQKARVLQDVRFIIKDAGGTVTPTTFLFEKKGRILFEHKDGLNPDDYLDQAIEAGATDIETDDEGRLVMFTEPTETKNVGETFTKATDLKIEKLEIIWDPNKDTLVKVENEKDVQQLEDLLGDIREEPSIHGIYLNTAQKF
ncbi:hypothetical protein DTO212C5_6151 [Paecilomyces variotii]|nr:hypothetical protein DTO212C5_6151 [Paecilomyces variotii]KAJ9361604.1 hypothetical protein DTO027B9_765 [Paecilomyces variotii]KAJ9409921.1 hypothetical protein DTO045G8_2397 [Paecilomyces variotii]